MSDPRALLNRDFRAEELAQNIRSNINSHKPKGEGTGKVPAAIREILQDEHASCNFLTDLDLLLNHILGRKES